LTIRRPCPSFQEFQLGASTPEFSPYHYLCDLDEKKSGDVNDAPPMFQKDIDVLYEMTESLWSLDLSSSMQKKLAIGLYNTHFASLINPHDATPIIRNDFLFLFYAMVKNDIVFDHLSPITRDCLKAAFRSLRGNKILSGPPALKTYIHESYLLDFLNSNYIRI